MSRISVKCWTQSCSVRSVKQSHCDRFTRFLKKQKTKLDWTVEQIKWSNVCKCNYFFFFLAKLLRRIPSDKELGRFSVITSQNHPLRRYVGQNVQVIPLLCVTQEWVTAVLQRTRSRGEADTHTHFSESGRMAPNCILLRATSKGYLNSRKHEYTRQTRMLAENLQMPISLAASSSAGRATAALTISSERRHRPRRRRAGSRGALGSGRRDCLKTDDPAAPGNVWGRDSSACRRWRMTILEGGETTATSTLRLRVFFYKLQPPKPRISPA